MAFYSIFKGPFILIFNMSLYFWCVLRELSFGVVNNGSVVITRKWSGAPGGGEFHQAARSVL